jgi:hypothetical protein
VVPSSFSSFRCHLCIYILDDERTLWTISSLHIFLEGSAWMATDFTPRELMLQSKSGILLQEKMALEASRGEANGDKKGGDHLSRTKGKPAASHRRRQRRKHGPKGVQNTASVMSDGTFVEEDSGLEYREDFYCKEKDRMDRKSESPLHSDLSWDLWVQGPITPLPLYELFEDLVRLEPFHESVIKGTQEDAHEFLGLLLTKLQEECEVILARRSREIQMGHLEENRPGLGWDRTCFVDREGQETFVIPKRNGGFHVMDAKEVALVESQNCVDDGESMFSRDYHGHADADVDGGGSEWVDVLDKGRTAVVEFDMNLHATPIQSLFGGVMRNLVRDVGSQRCEEEIPTSSSSSHRVPFLHVSLDVFDDSVLSVQDALSHLCHREIIEMSSSTPPKSVEMQTLFDDLPSILILHLKRFLFGMDTEKLSKPITITQDLEIPSPCVISRRSRPQNDRSYSLVGVVSHLGRFAVSGHYVADVRCGPYWMHMDDKKASLLCTVEDEERKWDDSDAYLLVYMRK